MTAARHLLANLGALDEKGTQTNLGREMARFPAHPRLARLLVAAIEQGCPGLGSDLVAILSERDLLSGPRQSSHITGPSDLLVRLELLSRDQSPRSKPVRRAASYWRRLTKAGHESAHDPDVISRLLAFAYPDRIGLKRKSGDQRYLLRNGQGATLAPSSVVRNAEWLVAVETTGRNVGEDEIQLASALTNTTVEELFGDSLQWQREAGWDHSENRVVAREVRRLVLRAA